MPVITLNRPFVSAKVAALQTRIEFHDGFHGGRTRFRIYVFQTILIFAVEFRMNSRTNLENLEIVPHVTVIIDSPSSEPCGKYFRLTAKRGNRATDVHYHRPTYVFTHRDV